MASAEQGQFGFEGIYEPRSWKERRAMKALEQKGYVVRQMKRRETGDEFDRREFLVPVFFLSDEGKQVAARLEQRHGAY
jgi:hypothetical protein